MNGTSKAPYILGLDLGVQSVGWAVIDLDQDGQPCGIRRAGVRCFDSGVGSETKISMGKDESANAARRQARLQRRQLWRRGRRLKKVFHCLQKVGLLPADEARTPQQRHDILCKLDVEFTKTFLPEHDRVAGHLLPYRLRGRALDEPLPPFAFGRALFHLAQRRGFLSNRKNVSRSGDNDLGEVKAGISELQGLIEQAKARTLGEYFSGLDPEDQRIRTRWTSRQMYLDEFEQIWAAQTPHHPDLGSESKERIYSAIFHQRPLKGQDSLVGMCELEPHCRRAPRASLEAQRFRYLQKVNDLEISTPDGQLWRLDYPQHAELRRNLTAILDTHAELEFKSMRSKLGLKKPRGCETDFQFNLEAGGEKKIKGNATGAKLRKVLGGNFDTLSPEQLGGVIDDLIAYEKKDALARRLTTRYGIPAEKAADLSEIALEDGYASLSREAMRKLLPLMETGVRFATAKKLAYGEYAGRKELQDFLPPVLQAVPQLRNPVVCRGLTELRKVVNALVREYGKPRLVRVELARDLKRSGKQREDIWKQNRQSEKARDLAREEIRAKKELGIDAPKGSDILKVLLAKECNWECPYTGKSICMDTLLGPSPQFDIEHIIPFSRSLDNSFQNKTLCDVRENRDVKQNRTPFEAYSGDETRWHEVVSRIKRFRGSATHAKLRKFQQKELDCDFAARMLQDTRYMSKLAAEYLGLLYGGQIDGDGRRRVQVSAGRVTAYLRDEWALNAILADGDQDEKNRADHRHHAVDAMVIALSDAGTVEMLSRSAALAETRGHRLFVREEIEKPWPTLLDDIRRAIDAVNISYRANRRVTGSLHEGTNYSKPQIGKDKKGKEVEYHYVRKPLALMTADMIENIVDDTVRDLVKKKIDQLGGFRKGMFTEPADHPYLTTRDGRIIPIHKARIRKVIDAKLIGKAKSPRFVKTEKNHHVEIVTVLDEQGKEKTWEGKIVDLRLAVDRINAHESAIQRKGHGPGRKFLFSLAKNEYVEMEIEPGERRLYRVVFISDGDLEFQLHTDAGPTNIEGRKRVRPSASTLRKYKARKVVVDPLGNILPAND